MALGAHMHSYSYIYYEPHQDGVLQQDNKECCDKVEELKAKIFVTTKKFISRHFSGATKNDKLVA